MNPENIRFPTFLGQKKPDGFPLDDALINRAEKILAEINETKGKVLTKNAMKA